MNSTMTQNADHGAGRPMSHARMAIWAVAAFLLLVPLVAMQFTDEVNWTGSDFAFAAVLLFVPLGVYELAVRKTRNIAYRAGVALALVTAFLLIWSNAAVGIADDTTADGLYAYVVLLGLIAAFIARFRPAGMAIAMLVTALATASVGVIALAAGWVAAHNSAFQILGITGFFVTLFAGSALLFREAARVETDRGAGEG